VVSLVFYVPIEESTLGGRGRGEGGQKGRTEFFCGEFNWMELKFCTRNNSKEGTAGLFAALLFRLERKREFSGELIAVGGSTQLSLLPTIISKGEG